MVISYGHVIWWSQRRKSVSKNIKSITCWQYFILTHKMANVYQCFPKSIYNCTVCIFLLNQESNLFKQTVFWFTGACYEQKCPPCKRKKLNCHHNSEWVADFQYKSYKPYQINTHKCYLTLLMYALVSVLLVVLLLLQWGDLQICTSGLISIFHLKVALNFEVKRAIWAL